MPETSTDRHLHTRVSADLHRQLRIQSAQQDTTIDGLVRRILQEHVEKAIGAAPALPSGGVT